MDNKKVAPKIDAAVSTFDDYEVIVPKNLLKKAVVKAKPGFKDDPIERAEAALAELATEFSGWMNTECDRLDAARNEVKRAGFNDTSRDLLFRAAHDIKGQAATFGFPLVEPVAESLCRLVEHTPDMARIPLALVDQHVDAIRAITHKNARGNTELTAGQLATKLRQVTDEFLRHENRDRPEYLDGIFAPSIAPDHP
jgi:HPt (histidine-containing phosphotransfer) domain-containing protein